MRKQNSKGWLSAALLFVLVLIPLLAADAAEVLTLDQCIQRSLERNPEVLASVERKVQAEWNKKAAHRETDHIHG